MVNSGTTTRLAAAATAALLAVPLLAPPGGAAPAAEQRRPLPRHIELPNNFQPEGIASRGKWAYLGSRVDGDIYRANLKTGNGRVISQGPGTASVGMKLDNRGRLFVAGGDAGVARVVNVRTGRVIRTYRLSSGSTFINDVILTPRAAWFTDSAEAQIYRVAIKRNGRLGRAVAFPLGGGWVQVPEFNANGIARTPDKKRLLVVNSSSGVLYRVGLDGRARAVDLNGVSLVNGDGLWREGRKLFVVLNRQNRVAVLRLNQAGTQGTLLRYRTSSDFDVPTTITRYKNSLYLPNARFTTTPTPTTEYWITRLVSRR